MSVISEGDATVSRFVGIAVAVVVVCGKVGVPVEIGSNGKTSIVVPVGTATGS